MITGTIIGSPFDTYILKSPRPADKVTRCQQMYDEYRGYKYGQYVTNMFVPQGTIYYLGE